MIKTMSLGTYASILHPYAKNKSAHEQLKHNLSGSYLDDFDDASGQYKLDFALALLDFLCASIEYPNLVKNRYNLINVFLYSVGLSNLLVKTKSNYAKEGENRFNQELPQFFSYCLANFTEKEKELVFSLLDKNDDKLTNCPAIFLINKIKFEAAIVPTFPTTTTTSSLKI